MKASVIGTTLLILVCIGFTSAGTYTDTISSSGSDRDWANQGSYLIINLSQVTDIDTISWKYNSIDSPPLDWYHSSGWPEVYFKESWAGYQFGHGHASHTDDTVTITLESWDNGGRTGTVNIPVYDGVDKFMWITNERSPGLHDSGSLSEHPVYFRDYANSFVLEGTITITGSGEMFSPDFSLTNNISPSSPDSNDVITFYENSSSSADHHGELLDLYYGTPTQMLDFGWQTGTNITWGTTAILNPGDYSFHSYTLSPEANAYTNFTVPDYNANGTNFEVSVADSSGSPLSGADVTLWYDGAEQDTYTTGISGSAFFSVPDYTHLNGTVTKSGYQSASYTYYKNYWDGWVSVHLFRTNETIPDDAWSHGNLILTFEDASTGEIITDAVTIDIYTDVDYTDLYDSGYTIDGHYWALVINGTTYYYHIISGAYQDGHFIHAISTTPEYRTISLLPKTYTTFEPEIRVWVYSTGTMQPIYNAYVSVSSSTDSGGGYTSLDGHYTYNNCSPIPTGSSRTYTVIASKGGYDSYTATVPVSTLSPTVNIYLSPSVEPSPSPTSNYTPVVTPVWSGTNGTPGNYKEQFLNFTMYQFGVDAWAAGILVGLVITILCAVFVGGCLAGYGSGNGAGVGAMIGGTFGWVASAMLGFIPLWALIVTIALVAMVFFVFKGGGSEG